MSAAVASQKLVGGNGFAALPNALLCEEEDVEVSFPDAISRGRHILT